MLALGAPLILAAACDSTQTQRPPPNTDWTTRTASGRLPDSMRSGATYLSVYSEIYSQTEQRTHDLTVTVSVRNVSERDTVYLDRAAYFDTHGRPIRQYLASSIYVAPMETLEIVIADREGGTGANLVFDWRTPPATPDPLFESVMISTSGQQGLSFATQGRRIR